MANSLGAIPAEPLSESSVEAVLDGDNAIGRTMSFITPSTRYAMKRRRDRLMATALNGRPPFNFDDATVERVFAVSKDGTRVPVMYVHAKGIELDGSHPTLLYACGGYGISMTPRFDPMNRLWLDCGGVYALAGIRGGGEYGEAWHVAGMLTRKQNVFDDFAAAMQYLVERKFTVPARLAIMGGSNGGSDDGCGIDAASGGDACRGERGGHLRFVAVGDAGQRGIQRHGVRQHEGSGAIQGAV